MIWTLKTDENHNDWAFSINFEMNVNLFIFFRRWMIGEDGLIVQKEDKNVLEFVAVKSIDSLKWAIPGVRGRHKVFSLKFLHKPAQSNMTKRQRQKTATFYYSTKKDT